MTSIADAYAEYYLSTDAYYQSVYSGRKVIDAISLRNHSLRRAFSGKDPKKIIQNGTSIKNFIQLEHKNTAHFFGAGATESVSDPQLVTEMETPWAFIRDGQSWDEETFDLHEGNQAQRFFDLRRAMDQQTYQELVRFMETEAFWATPVEASMETASPKPPIRHVTPWNVLVNEETNGVPLTYTAGTVQQISRTTYAGWRPQQKSYLGGPQAATSTLLPALGDTARRCKFKGLPLGLAEYGDKSTMPAVVWCSFNGYTMLEEEMRNRQDLFVHTGRQDPAFPGITIYGVPVEELDVLETAVIFPNSGGTGYTTEDDPSTATGAAGGPRFFLMNLADMYVVCHAKKFFYKHKPLTPHNMPNRRVSYIDSYCNTTAETCRTSGIVYPSEDIAGYIS